MGKNILQESIKRKEEKAEKLQAVTWFNEEEYNSGLSEVEGKKKEDEHKKKWKIKELERKLEEDDSDRLLNKIDWNVFEHIVNQEELKDICKKSIKNWMLEIDNNGKIIWAYVNIWWEKRSSKLFNNFLKTWFSREQALKTWLQVRSKAFKNWFGDWINDPQNASKIVDENGEPLVVYHGSAKRFKEFDANKIGSTTGDNSWFYFSNNRKIAKDYYSKETGNGWDNLKLMFGLSRKYKPTVYDCFLKSSNPYIQDFNGDYDNIGRQKIIAEAKKKWHDVIILKNIIDGPGVVQDVYVAFHPNQIKIEYAK